MNRMLALLAAGILAAAPVAVAMAEDHVIHVENAVDAEAAVDMAVESHEYTLKDGAMLHVEGDMAYVMDAEGNKVAAPAGEHTLADGTVVTVSEDGHISGLPVVEAPAEGETAE